MTRLWIVMELDSCGDSLIKVHGAFTNEKTAKLLKTVLGYVLDSGNDIEICETNLDAEVVEPKMGWRLQAIVVDGNFENPQITEQRLPVPEKLEGETHFPTHHVFYSFISVESLRANIVAYQKANKAQIAYEAGLANIKATINAITGQFTPRRS